MSGFSSEIHEVEAYWVSRYVQKKREADDGKGSLMRHGRCVE